MDLTNLYVADETAWLDLQASLIRSGRSAELDLENLGELLESMANRDRRAVESRLVKLILHILKWEHQPGRRGGSWHGTILEQRRRLRQLVRGGSLRRHAEAVLVECYGDGVAQAAAETGLPPGQFPAHCPWTLDELLAYTPAPEGGRAAAPDSSATPPACPSRPPHDGGGRSHHDPPRTSPARDQSGLRGCRTEH